jgi:ferredoxin
MGRALVPAAGAAVVLALLFGGALTVSRFEEQDTFCISCHTLPEVTYYERAQGALSGESPYQDLSSAHYALPGEGGELLPMRCIDCHRGNGGLPHRVVTLTLGARDAALWIAGQADPEIEKNELEVPFLLTAACTECHQPSLLTVGFNNHFHNRLPDAYRAWRRGAELIQPEDQPGNGDAEWRIEPVDTGVLCVDCHRAHVHVPGSELQSYLDVFGVVYPACVRCHEDAGRGPLELARRPDGMPAVFAAADVVNLR